MILNGKAKDCFLEYYDTSTIKFLIDGKDFDDLPLYFQQSLLVNWFDSAGIFVNIDVISENNSLELSDWFFVIKINNEDVDFITNDYYYNSRQEATTEGIKKANEIFNSL